MVRACTQTPLTCRSPPLAHCCEPSISESRKLQKKNKMNFGNTARCLFAPQREKMVLEQTLLNALPLQAASRRVWRLVLLIIAINRNKHLEMNAVFGV